jgi:hypothetical protein
LSDPPVEDAAGGEADKSLRLPCEMPARFNPYITFNQGRAYFSGVMFKTITRHRTLAGKSPEHQLNICGYFFSNAFCLRLKAMPDKRSLTKILIYGWTLHNN